MIILSHYGKDKNQMIIVKKNNQMSFGGDYGKDTGDCAKAVKDAIATMAAAIPETFYREQIL